jgi:hypothetical protein
MTAATKLKGVVLRTPEVQSLARDGRVVVEREVKPAPPERFSVEAHSSNGLAWKFYGKHTSKYDEGWPEGELNYLYCPFGAPGERRAVRETDRRCPKCNGQPSRFVEHWAGHSIVFDATADGAPEAEGHCDTNSDPTHVEAICACGYRWKLKGVIQITDVRPKALAVVVESVEVAPEPWRWRVTLVKSD